MDIISAYREVGWYRGAAELCGTIHKTVKRIVEQFEADDTPRPRARNYDAVTELVTSATSSQLRKRMGCIKGGVVANVVIPTPRLRPLRHPLRLRPRLLPRQ
jgi:hypothetical protein